MLENEELYKNIQDFINDNVPEFHTARAKALEKWTLSSLLLRKNPYLFRAKNILTSQEYVQKILDASLSSSEETIFGNFLEKLAIFTCKSSHSNSIKSAAEGLDLEFESDGIRYLVAIKSGPNWGNSSQLKKLSQIFLTAGKTLRTSSSNVNFKAVNGICYGRNAIIDKGNYYKYVGKSFWKLISGDENLYMKIIHPLGVNAKEHNDSFIVAYTNVTNKLTSEFSKQFCLPNGAIDWESLVVFNSGTEALRKSLSKKR